MKELVAKLEGLLRLRSIPFGMKLYESVAEMEAIPKIRRPKQSVHTLDQVVGQASRLGWTVGITTQDLVGDQCRSVVGLGGQDDKWYSGQHMVGVWYATPVDAASAHRTNASSRDRPFVVTRNSIISRVASRVASSRSSLSPMLM